jgi:hypothetical protein
MSTTYSWGKYLFSFKSLPSFERNLHEERPDILRGASADWWCTLNQMRVVRKKSAKWAFHSLVPDFHGVIGIWDWFAYCDASLDIRFLRLHSDKEHSLAIKQSNRTRDSKSTPATWAKRLMDLGSECGALIVHSGKSSHSCSVRKSSACSEESVLSTIFVERLTDRVLPQSAPCGTSSSWDLVAL